MKREWPGTQFQHNNSIVGLGKESSGLLLATKKMASFKLQKTKLFRNLVMEKCNGVIDKSRANVSKLDLE